MNQKTDLPHEELSSHEKEFTRGFLPSLIFLTIVILVGVMASENRIGWLSRYGFHPSTSEPPLTSLLPTRYTSFKTISDGLSAFSGKVIPSPHLVLTIETLASILLTYVIIPTVFLFNWRRRRIENKSISSSDPLSVSSIIYALSIILTISISVVTITSASMATGRQRSLEHAQDIQSNRDEILYGLNRIAIDAYQYRVLPKELGGGNGTYDGFVLAPEQAKTQSAFYTMTTSENQLHVEARSLLFTSGVIHTTIDDQGKMQHVNYTGVFE